MNKPMMVQMALVVAIVLVLALLDRAAPAVALRCPAGDLPCRGRLRYEWQQWRCYDSAFYLARSWEQPDPTLQCVVVSVDAPPLTP